MNSKQIRARTNERGISLNQSRYEIQREELLQRIEASTTVNQLKECLIQLIKYTYLGE